MNKIMTGKLWELKSAINGFCWREYREDGDFHDLHEVPLAYCEDHGQITRVALDMSDMDDLHWLFMTIDEQGEIKTACIEADLDSSLAMLTHHRHASLIREAEACVQRHARPMVDEEAAKQQTIETRKEQIIARLVSNAEALDEQEADYMAADLHENDNMNAAVQLMAEAECFEQRIGEKTYSPEYSRSVFARLDYVRVCAAVQRVLKAAGVRNQRGYLLKSLHGAQTMLV